PSSLLNHVGQETEEARALDGLCQEALLLRRDRGDAGGNDLAALRDEAGKQTDVLVVDLRRVIARERAGLAAPEERATATAAATTTFAAAITTAVAAAFTIVTIAAHWASPSVLAGAASRGPRSERKRSPPSRRGRSSRSPRGPRSRSPRGPRSPRSSRSRPLLCSMADGPSSSASTRTVRWRITSSWMRMLRSISITAAAGASMLISV